jgi:hypothetical protein
MGKMGTMTFTREDRVRLHPQLAERLMKRELWKCRKRIDWLARRGTVMRVPRFSDNIGVQWDDRASCDHWPARALEKLNGSG